MPYRSIGKILRYSDTASPGFRGCRFAEIQRKLSIKCRESCFPAVKAVCLNCLSDNGDPVKAVSIYVVDSCRNGNVVEHCCGVSSGSKLALILEDELGIELTDRERVACDNANNRPTLAELADKEVARM